MTEHNQTWVPFARHVGPYGHYQRVESPLTGKGIPDSNICINGRECWVENKVGATEGRRPASLKLEQVLWMEERARAGGMVYMLVKYGNTNATCLYNTMGVRALWDRREAYSLVRSVGEYPTKEILRVICHVS